MDPPAADYTAPPPWQKDALSITTFKLSKAKAKLTTQERQQQGNIALKTANQERAREYFTDGSVEPSNGRAAAAFISSSGVAQQYRLQDGAPILQAELTAIKGALQHAQQDRTQTPITIHTDSLAALQTLRKTHSKDNIGLTTSIWAIAQDLQRRRRPVNLNWIPSHVGTPGNEAADAEAKRALTQDRVRIPIPHSLFSRPFFAYVGTGRQRTW